jgi:hypothetical protein
MMNDYRRRYIARRLMLIDDRGRKAVTGHLRVSPLGRRLSNYADRGYRRHIAAGRWTPLDAASADLIRLFYRCPQRM